MAARTATARRRLPFKYNQKLRFHILLLLHHHNKYLNQTSRPIPIISLICPESESIKIWVWTHLFLLLGSRSADWRIAIRLLANFLFCIIESLFLFPSTFRMLTRIFDALVVNFKQFQALLNHLFVITRESRFSRELDSLQT